jgi:hypothetical protein
MIVTIFRTSDDGSGATDRGAGSSAASKPGNAAGVRLGAEAGAAGGAPCAAQAGDGGAEDVADRFGVGAGGAAGGIDVGPAEPPPSSIA